MTHHLAKTKDNISTPEQARVLVRGSTAIVDRTRATYVLWSVSEARSKELCAAINMDWARERVFCGCVAKENSGGDKSIKTYVRNRYGLLEVQDAAIRQSKAGSQAMLEQDMVQAVAEAAEALQPFAKTGANGLYARRAELPKSLASCSKHTLESMVDILLDKEMIVLCIPIGGTTKNRLDVPDGPIARAESRIQPGARD